MLSSLLPKLPFFEREQDIWIAVPGRCAVIKLILHFSHKYLFFFFWFLVHAGQCVGLQEDSYVKMPAE